MNKRLCWLFVFSMLTCNLLAQEFCVKTYGALGDGVTDDSGAFRQALNAAVKQPHAVVKVPSGNYRLASQVRVSFKGGVDHGLTLIGEGQGVSVISCANSDGAISLRSELCQTMISIRDLTLIATQPAAGTALEITSSLRGVRNYRTLTVENVDMRGSGLPTRNYFKRGLNASAQWRPLFRNLIFGGVLDPALKRSLHEERVRDLYYAPEYAFAADWCYAPSFQHCYAWSCHTGYRVVSKDQKPEGPEDGAFYRCNAVETVVGIDINTPIIEPQLVIDSCHLNCREVGLRLTNRKFFHIVNSLFYTHSKIDNRYVDIELKNCWAGFIQGNMFHSPHPDNMKALPRSKRICITLDNLTKNIMITGNTFNGKGKVYDTAPKTENNQISNNMIVNRHVEMPQNTNEE